MRPVRIRQARRQIVSSIFCRRKLLAGAASVSAQMQVKAGGMDPPYPAHNLLHRDNCFGLASLANLDKLPR